MDSFELMLTELVKLKMEPFVRVSCPLLSGVEPMVRPVPLNVMPDATAGLWVEVVTFTVPLDGIEPFCQFAVVFQSEDTEPVQMFCA